jgi:hypothetical protein
MTAEEMDRILNEKLDAINDRLPQAIREAERRGWERCREAAANEVEWWGAFSWIQGDHVKLVKAIRTLKDKQP